MWDLLIVFPFMIFQEQICFDVHGEIQRRSLDVVERIYVSASSQQSNDAILALGFISIAAPYCSVQGCPLITRPIYMSTRIEQNLDAALIKRDTSGHHNQKGFNQPQQAQRKKGPKRPTKDRKINGSIATT